MYCQHSTSGYTLIPILCGWMAPSGPSADTQTSGVQKPFPLPPLRIIQRYVTNNASRTHKMKTLALLQDKLRTLLYILRSLRTITRPPRPQALLLVPLWIMNCCLILLPLERSEICRQPRLRVL